MYSTLKSRPNHYEMLRLHPTAGADEIARAFAQRLGEPVAFGGVARLSMAYEVLRDPHKRRAYDESIGIKPLPNLVRGYSPTAGPVGARFQNPAMALASRGPALASGPASGSTDASEPIEPAITEQPRLAPLLAKLRDLAKSDPLPERVPEQVHATAARRRQPAQRPTLERQAKAQQRAPVDSELERILGQRLEPVKDGAVGLKRAAWILAALVAVAGGLGTWLGLEAGNDMQPEQSQATTEAGIAPSPPSSNRIGATPDAAPTLIESGREQAAPATLTPAPVRRPSSSLTQRTAAPAPQTAQASESAAIGAPAGQVTTSSETADSEPVPTPALAANLPLPTKVIARTIDAIGYSCGQVASTTAVGEGAAGVFKVTCTSGQSYQAKPVGGRYRFRRWGRQ